MICPSRSRSPPRSPPRGPPCQRSRSPSREFARRSDMFTARSAHSPPHQPLRTESIHIKPQAPLPAAPPRLAVPPAAPVATAAQDVKKTQIKRKRGWDMSRTGLPAGAPAAQPAAVPATSLPGPPGPSPIAPRPSAAGTAAATAAVTAQVPAVVSPGQGWEAEVVPQFGRGLSGQEASLPSIPSGEHSFSSVGLVCP